VKTKMMSARSDPSAAHELDQAKLPKELRVNEIETLKYESKRYRLPPPLNYYIPIADYNRYMKVAYIICIFELSYYIICILLNIIHFGIYLPNPPIAYEGSLPTIVFICTLIELSIAVILQVCGVKHQIQ
jgi:hypothetical protein